MSKKTDWLRLAQGRGKGLAGSGHNPRYVTDAADEDMIQERTSVRFGQTRTNERERKWYCRKGDAETGATLRAGKMPQFRHPQTCDITKILALLLFVNVNVKLKRHLIPRMEF